MTIVTRYCRKSNQLQSVQGYGMHRTHKTICKSKKQKESDAVATLVASYCRKLISSNPCRGMECKKPIKLFISSRNKKKEYCRKLVGSHPCRGLECKEPKKYLNIGKRNRKNVLPWQHLLPVSVEKLVSSKMCWGLECKETTKIFI